MVQECLHGNEGAWAMLIDRYKNLIFSIPIKLGFSPDDAADIFQSVCLAMVEELPRLREPRALPAWLIRTTSHKCYRWKDTSRRFIYSEEQHATFSDKSAELPDDLLQQLDREQIVRDAVSELPQDCKRLVELLFYQVSPPSYEDLALAMEIPKGSIGPRRQRCLEKMRQLLLKKGF
jgi:RNA polymerase sigma factor (sigma-70 family)